MEDKKLFTVRVDAGEDADDELLAELTRRLRKDLLTLDEVERAEPAAAAAPPGTKSAGIDLQTLLVTLASTGGVITTLIGFMQTWVTRRDKASITLEMGGDKITISGASSDAERRLVEDWVSRHKSVG